MFYSYCPDDGIRFHDTADEAKERAEKALSYKEFSAADSDWCWDDNEEEISWGEVRQKVYMNKRDLTAAEKAENPEWEFHAAPELEDVPAIANQQP